MHGPRDPSHFARRDALDDRAVLPQRLQKFRLHGLSGGFGRIEYFDNLEIGSSRLAHETDSLDDEQTGLVALLLLRK